MNQRSLCVHEAAAQVASLALPTRRSQIPRLGLRFPASPSMIPIEEFSHELSSGVGDDRSPTSDLVSSTHSVNSAQSSSISKYSIYPVNLTPSPSAPSSLGPSYLTQKCHVYERPVSQLFVFFRHLPTSRPHSIACIFHNCTSHSIPLQEIDSSQQITTTTSTSPHV